MHVGLNLVFLTPGEQGGLEIYARELIPRLVAAAPEHRFTAFVNLDGRAAAGPWNELDATVTVPIHAANRTQWVRGEQQLLPRLARRAGVHLVHSLASTELTNGVTVAWADRSLTLSLRIVPAVALAAGAAAVSTLIHSPVSASVVVAAVSTWLCSPPSR